MVFGGDLLSTDEGITDAVVGDAGWGETDDAESGGRAGCTVKRDCVMIVGDCGPVEFSGAIETVTWGIEGLGRRDWDIGSRCFVLAGFWDAFPGLQVLL